MVCFTLLKYKHWDTYYTFAILQRHCWGKNTNSSRNLGEGGTQEAEGEGEVDNQVSERSQIYKRKQGEHCSAHLDMPRKQPIISKSLEYIKWRRLFPVTFIPYSIAICFALVWPTPDQRSIQHLSPCFGAQLPPCFPTTFFPLQRRKHQPKVPAIIAPVSQRQRAAKRFP